MTKVNNGIDNIADAIGSLSGASLNTGTSSTAPTATTYTCDGATGITASSGGPPATGGLVGQLIVSRSTAVYGIIVSNTTTVLTIDYWHDPTNPGGAAGSTPAAGTWLIVPATSAAAWIALSTATRVIAAADAFLTNDGTTVSELFATGGGLNRALATYAHTVGTATYTLTKAFTSNSNDGTNTINRIGVFYNGVTAAPTTSTTGQMLNEINVSSPPTVVGASADQVTVTVTYTIS